MAIIMIQEWRFSLRQIGSFPADPKRVAAFSSACMSATMKDERQGRQNFTWTASAI
jgi:hypothetical protein